MEAPSGRSSVPVKPEPGNIMVEVRPPSSSQEIVPSTLPALVIPAAEPNHILGEPEDVDGSRTLSDKGKGHKESLDSESVKGIFGWETVDNTSIPYLLRKGRKFVSVRIVEKKLLSKYPNTFPDELGQKDPLVSYFITDAEANLLNEINTTHCDFEYGKNPFTSKDLIVDLEEFGEFFKIVKKTFPEEVLATIKGELPPPEPFISESQQKVEPSQYCGWIQINNTVSPYIIRYEGKEKVRLVPLSVIVYAAGLLTNMNVEGLLPTLLECKMLNAACQAAGFDFTFGKNTRLIDIAEVVQRCQVQLLDLPFKNPLQHAHYMDPRSGQPTSSLLTNALRQPLRHIPRPAVPAQAAPIMSMGPMVPNSAESATGRSSIMNPFTPAFSQAQANLVRMAKARGPPNVSLAPQAMPNVNLPVDVNHLPTALPKTVSDKLHGIPSNIPHSFWAMLPSHTPPAHPNSSMKSSVTSKSPSIPSEATVPHSYPSLIPPANSTPYSNTPELMHPAFQSSGQTISSLRDSTQGQGPTSHLPSNSMFSGQPGVPFGVNQFNSSLFARTDLAKSKSPSNCQSFTPPQSQGPSRRSSAPAAHTSKAPSPPQRSSTSSPLTQFLMKSISACLVNGRSISCLNIDSASRKGRYCLVEAVSKLYFPSVPIWEFLKVLQTVLKAHLYECTDEEETAFIQYYNLPVSKLKCNQMILVDDLQKFFPQLNYVFNKGSSDKPMATGEQSLKRSLTPPSAGPPAKQMMPRLENVVQKLHQQVPSVNAGGDAPAAPTPTAGGGGVIVIDD